MNLLLVGCGKMGGAMLARWRDLSLFTKAVVVEPHTQSIPSGTNIFVNQIAGFKPDVIVFAVKPQTLPDIIHAYQEFNNALFISIAAGTPSAFFEKNLGAGAAIIRAMPNTPAAIGHGATVAFANKNVTEPQKIIAEKLLSVTGLLRWIADESLMNAVTALSGSGPAYVFLLMESLAKSGEKLGLSPTLAMDLARQTIIGSALLAQNNADTSAEDLCKNVTSPGGTTAAALEVLMHKKDGWQDILDRALLAARDRGKTLGG
jgi:pyrroline-5-carboxylate reductase